MRATDGVRLAMRAVGATALLLVFLVGPVRAQAGASTGLMGQVTDSSGAAVPGAAITLTHVETGRVRTVTTNPTGDWEARFLSPGTYRVTFELSGFKTLRREGISVSVNVVLEVGTVTEAVEVIANAEMVSSGSMTVQRTLDQKELEALPTSARNFTQLLVIEPGVSADISELLSNDNASISPSVNGARTTNNSFVFNGIDVTNLLCCNSRINGSSGTIENGGGSLSRNVAPAPETLQEVKLQTASTTQAGGGTAAATSRSSERAARTASAAAPTTTTRTTR
jgi:Carboxypeptidase regulatory-like domain